MTLGGWKSPWSEMNINIRFRGICISTCKPRVLRKNDTHSSKSSICCLYRLLSGCSNSARRWIEFSELRIYQIVVYQVSYIKCSIIEYNTSILYPIVSRMVVGVLPQISGENQLSIHVGVASCHIFKSGVWREYQKRISQSIRSTQGCYPLVN